MEKSSIGRKTFIICNSIFLILLAFSCLFPFIHILAVSLSSKIVALSGEVKLLPVEFTIDAYRFILQKKEFTRAMGVTFKRIALGVPLDIFLIVLISYPLSKETGEFRFRTFYSWVCMFKFQF
jgi:putative aldouronate transport system permease protein